MKPHIIEVMEDQHDELRNNSITVDNRPEFDKEKTYILMIIAVIITGIITVITVIAMFYLVYTDVTFHTSFQKIE